MAKRVIQVHAVDGAGHVLGSRKLIVAHARDNPVVMTVHKRSDPIAKWAAALRDRAGWQKAAVALTNKNARILWTMMTKGEAFDARHVSVKPGAPAAPVPRQRSSGGKNNLGGIPKRGDTYLRTLLIQGAKSAVMTAHHHKDKISAWVLALRERSGWQKAVVALANKNARILWAVMTKGEAFNARHVSVKPGAAAPATASA